MTSFIINAHLDRKSPSSWKQDPECPFCRILRGELPAYRVYENDKVIAILDILPLRRGHTLVIPKAHFSNLSDLPAEFAAATGEAISKVANALTKISDNKGLNVVCNQEYAQAVPHVHYHIVPAPVLGASSKETPKADPRILTRREMHQMEFESREELDEEDAEVLLRDLRARL